jgi:hypothetical protein
MRRGCRPFFALQQQQGGRIFGALDAQQGRDGQDRRQRKQG